MVFDTIGRAFTPKFLRPKLNKYFSKAGLKEVPYSLFGILFMIILIIFYFSFLFFFFPKFKVYSGLLLFFLYFFSSIFLLSFLTIFFIMLLYIYFDIKIYNRTKLIESFLPDYLTLVSTNLKGGSSFEQALWLSIKPEFGPLSQEMAFVAKKAMTGDDIIDSLTELSNKYDSPMLKRNFSLIISELEAGGSIVKVIDKIVDNLKKANMLKKEINASIVTYILFISLLVLFLSPILYALSLQLFSLINNFMSSISLGNAASVGFNIGASSIKESDFKFFSILAIILTAIGSSALISIIEKGSLRAMVKYLSLFLIISIIIYFLALSILQTIFSSII